ncbi:MAG: FAD-dependent oxidoreductase [candidate division WS1 bacterium]|jgi:thioredoxin reductase (NADPH)|nr:FAD-dependent oxidoreductase [candidate division WS1 bacterium]
MAQGDLTCDVHIIGGGPAGYTAGIYAARAGLKTVISTPAALSGMMAMAPTVGNWPSQVEPAPGRDILERIHDQALNAGAEVVLESVAGVNFSEERGLQVFGGAQVHVARAVVVATGAMSPAEKVPGEEDFLGRGVAYCVACDGPLFAEEPVIVVGLDQHAAEEALALSEIASSVVFATPARTLNLDDHLAGALAETPNVTVETGVRLQEIVGDQSVEGGRFKDTDGNERIIAGTGIFMYLRGNEPATEFLLGAVDLDEKGFIITDELLATSMPGVYAAGDVRHKVVRQQVVAAGEGAVAALSAERFVRGSERIAMQRGIAR